MKTYAMVLLGNVINVLYDQSTVPYYPPDPDGNPVTAIPCNSTVTPGMLYDEVTGTFTEDNRGVPDPAEPDEPKSQLDRIEEKLNALTADSVTTESIEAAILEGVNEV